MTRFICLGDSFTEGLVDELRPDGRHLGWADRVARALASAQAQHVSDAPTDIAKGGSSESIEQTSPGGRTRPGVVRMADDGVWYANLAIRGKLLDQVIAEQLPICLSMQPDLVSFQAGLNDVLRPSTDLDVVFIRYAEAVAEVRATGAEVLLFTGRGRSGWNSRIATTLEPRFRSFNENVRAVAKQNGCHLVDLEAIEMLSDPRCWGKDRLHLNEVGHARVAAAVLAALGVDDPAIFGGALAWWREPLPQPVEPSRARSASDELFWVTRHLVPWIVRRLRGVSSGDGLVAKDSVFRLITPRP